jgi:hypothetical protein
MRFCHPFILTANARDAEQTLARHQRARAKASVQCDQPPFIVLFPRAIFLQPIVHSTASPRNLTEFLFAHNFSKPDLEVL